MALGTKFRAWTHDDAASDLYILYSRWGVAPFCGSPVEDGNCYPQNMVRTKVGAPGAATKILPLEFFVETYGYPGENVISMAADVFAPPAAPFPTPRTCIYMSDHGACNIKRMDRTSHWSSCRPT